MRFFPEKTTLGWFGVAFVWLVSGLLIWLLLWSANLKPTPQYKVEKMTFTCLVHKPSLETRRYPKLGYRYKVYKDKWSTKKIVRFALVPVDF